MSDIGLAYKTDFKGSKEPKCIADGWPLTNVTAKWMCRSSDKDLKRIWSEKGWNSKYMKDGGNLFMCQLRSNGGDSLDKKRLMFVKRGQLTSVSSKTYHPDNEMKPVRCAIRTRDWKPHPISWGFIDTNGTSHTVPFDSTKEVF